MKFDIVITGGVIMDGAGRRRCRADLGILNGRIESIAPPAAALESCDIIDAHGMVTTSVGAGRPFSRQATPVRRGGMTSLFSPSLSIPWDPLSWTASFFPIRFHEILPLTGLSPGFWAALSGTWVC